MSNVAVLDVISDVAQIARRAPNGTLINAYIRAARKFCRESRWFRSTLPGSTVEDVQVYDLGSDPYLEVLGLKAVTITPLTGSVTTTPLSVSDSSGWNPNTANSQPTRYAYVPEGQVAFWPTPDTVYSLILTLVLQPKLGANVVPSELLVKWDQALQDGTLGYLLDLPGQPWTDPQQAAIRKRAFQSAISNAKADEQRAYNAGTVFTNRRPFIVGRM